jgi:hypothetical protein
VKEWLSGTVRPTLIQLDRLAATIGCDISEFFEPPDENAYRTHSRPSKLAHMRDYVNELDEQRAAGRRELDGFA